MIARTAAQASMGSPQDKPMKRPAWTVSRTRDHLLRAVLELPALATQGTVATPAQEHAQRVLQASTNLLQAIVIARTAKQANTGPL